MNLEIGEKVTILDEYDCLVMTDRIRIAIDNPRDPSLTDIMSEIYYSDGYMYFDGSYYKYINEYNIDSYERGWYLDLFVERDNRF